MDRRRTVTWHHGQDAVGLITDTVTWHHGQDAAGLITDTLTWHHGQDAVGLITDTVTWQHGQDAAGLITDHVWRRWQIRRGDTFPLPVDAVAPRLSSLRCLSDTWTGWRSSRRQGKCHRRQSPPPTSSLAWSLAQSNATSPLLSK